MSRGDGGAAFPVIPPVHAPSGEPLAGWPAPDSGMTLRDYFAAKALQGYFAAPYTPHRNAAGPEVAEYCYAMADAMLAARGAK